MKKHFGIWFTALAVLAMSSCKTKKETVNVPLKDFPSIENILPLQLPAEVNYKGIIDNFEILETRQDGQFLLVKVAYSGGCNEHFFEASWDELQMKSLPPQVNIRMTHVNNDDACRARIEKELAIDLRKLFQSVPNDVYVNLNGNSDGKILVSPQE